MIVKSRLPGIFEVYQLAIGPSSKYTNGALKIGQAFRDILDAGILRNNHRILIELYGAFKSSRVKFNIDQAVVFGLGGYSLEDWTSGLQLVFDRIKTNGCFQLNNEVWPFNPESDIINGYTASIGTDSDLVRFHILSTSGEPVYQADYTLQKIGRIDGPGITVRKDSIVDQPVESWSSIRGIVDREHISLTEYGILSECNLHNISREQFISRMTATWKYMAAGTDNLEMVKSSTIKDSDVAHLTEYDRYLKYMLSNSYPLQGFHRASAIAFALGGNIIENRPVITAPTCFGAAILPSLFRHYQERYLLPDDKIIDGLIVSGLFGSLIIRAITHSEKQTPWRIEVGLAASMVSAGISTILGRSVTETEKAAVLAARLFCCNRDEGQGFDANEFLVLNTLIVQTIPSLIDCLPAIPESIIPEFDVVLDQVLS